MIHQTAEVQTSKIGSGTRIWQHVVVLPGASIGARCNICANCFIEDDVIIGDDVTIKCGVSIWNGVTIGDKVFIGPSVAFTNDKRPRSRQWLTRDLKTIVREGASIGANATVLPVVVGAHAMVGAGAVVTKDVPPYAIVVGNPARIVGYVDAAKIEKSDETPKTMPNAQGATGAKMINIPVFSDIRGDLNVIEIEKILPFKVRRLFYTYNVPSSDVRGQHAHRKCEQFLVAIHGHCRMIADNGREREEYALDSPNYGLYMPAGLWGIQYRHSHDCVLLVLASMPYDDADYIRDYDEYLEYIEVAQKAVR